jgi:hypothetical protein
MKRGSSKKQWHGELLNSHSGRDGGPLQPASPCRGMTICSTKHPARARRAQRLPGSLSRTPLAYSTNQHTNTRARNLGEAARNLGKMKYQSRGRQRHAVLVDLFLDALFHGPPSRATPQGRRHMSDRLRSAATLSPPPTLATTPPPPPLQP